MYHVCMDCLVGSVLNKGINSYLGEVIDVLESTLEIVVGISEMVIKATDLRFSPAMQVRSFTRRLVYKRTEGEETKN